ncbi:hypothetical protein J7T55_014120 [Diaporthe amygdali]|uniref:uncharacterized protein n=1 Tax=Phomopsis amygdali TaxID=1214568 RepID=UPI0022FF1C17|nr:uncharacterized protein J7T55_014120 [Diaporthe amygdali]KAJ0109558.1 hypothetical protein J7T55_014120 [Diaporthe amygdali]
MDTNTDRKFPPGGWHSLPTELMTMIIEMLAWPDTKAPVIEVTRPQTAPVFARYSTISRQWQSLIERILFKHLILNQHDMDCFGRTVTGPRTAFVQHIWLRIVLPAYDCKSCRKEESEEEIVSHNLDYTNAIWQLFGFLSSPAWNEKRHHSAKGITLELSAHSLTDTAHFGKDLKMRSNDTAWGDKNERRVWIPWLTHDDVIHDWQEGRKCRSVVPTGAKRRLFGPPRGLCLDRDASFVRLRGAELPEVNAIHALVIRRQFYRAFSIRKGLAKIFRSLPRLQELVYEPWRGPPADLCGLDGIPAVQNDPSRPHAQLLYMDTARLTRDFDHMHFFSKVLSDKPNLKRVSIFEDVDDVFFEANPRTMADPKTINPSRPNIGDSVICWAAKAAERMPRLEVMELWSSQRFGFATIFRFERRERQPRIQLLSTRPSHLTEIEEAHWQRVVDHLYPGLGVWLEVEVTLLDMPTILGPASVIDLLMLKDRVLHPVSLRQMHIEDQRRKVTYEL